MVLMIRGVGGGVNVGKGEGGVILLLVRSVDSGICVCVVYLIGSLLRVATERLAPEWGCVHLVWPGLGEPLSLAELFL